MQVETEEVTVQEAIREIVQLEVEEDEGDPLEGLTKLKPEDKRLFRQFKRFHKTYYQLHGHDAPSHQLAQGIIREMFSGLPVRDAETIANTRAELLAVERLKDLCKQLGLVVPVELQTYSQPQAPEYPPPPPPLCFPSRQDKERQAQAPTEQPLGESDVKLDIKPPRRLATSYLGKPGLLRMIGTGDKDHIITNIVPGNAPLQDYDEEDPAQLITIDYKTDESDEVDDLSVVSMSSAGGVGRNELQGLLSDIAANHQKMAASIDALAARVTDMTTEQVEETAVRVTSEIGGVRGLEEITNVFDKSEVALILVTGVRKFHEYQTLKGLREESDIISYRQLEKKFGSNKRTIMECTQGYKYHYPKGKSTKVPFTLTRPEEEEEDVETKKATSKAAPTPAMGAADKPGSSTT